MTRLTAAEAYDRAQTLWGRGADMTAYESALWHLSDRQTLRSASVIVEILDRPPDWERLVNAHVWGLGRVPRLRQRVVADPLRLGPPAWTDTKVDLDYHLRRLVLGDGAGLSDVFAFASTMHEEAFARDRPLWLATLLEGLPGGQAAWILKLHHALADGEEVVALFELLHSRVRESTIGPATLPPAPHEHRSRLGLAAHHAAQLLWRAPVTGARAARVGGDALRDPRGSVMRTLHTAEAAGRSGSAVRLGPSPVLRARGTHRAFDAVVLTHDALRATADNSGALIGEVAAAALIAGIGRYHAALGDPVSELRISVPLNRRAEHHGQRLARAHITAPAGAMSLSERIIRLRARLTAAEQRPTVDLVRLAAPAVSRMPNLVIGPIIEGAARPLALRTFAIRGLNRDAYLAGAQVSEMFSFAPTEGAAISATLLNHQNRVCLAFNYDTAAVTDVETMRRSVRAALTAALGTGSWTEAAS
ncbi:MAG: diacylglycerol O-acyltransferase / wax synthase [Solirubrobacteraceae bacterium]|nr:diacylglycerol O-acyltransferase / wax synthase [Solirubrobacteraceae bacterium]